MFTKYEVQAYVDSMQSAYLIETKQWQEALDKLLNSKALYQKIMEYRDSIEAVIYQEKIAELDTFIRLCCTNLKMQSSQKAEKDFEGKKKALQSKVAQAYQEMKQEKISNIEHIAVGSKRIPLKSERLKQTFKKIETQTNALEELEKSLDPSGQDQAKIGELIKGYLKLVDIIDDAQSVIKKEKAEESKTSEQSGQLYNILIIYTQRLKIKASVDRNLLQAKQLQHKFSVDLLFIPKSQQDHQTNIRAQNVIRFYEKAIKAQKQLMNIEKEIHVQGPSSDGASSSLDPLALLQSEFQEKYQQIHIYYFCALHYVQEQQSQGTRQAMIILQGCVYKIEEAIEFVNTNGLKSAKVQSMVEELQKVMLAKVKYALCKTMAKHLSNKN